VIRDHINLRVSIKNVDTTRLPLCTVGFVVQVDQIKDKTITSSHLCDIRDGWDSEIWRV